MILGDPTLRSLAYANGWWLFWKSALAHVGIRGLRILKLLLTTKPEQRPIDVDKDLAIMRHNFVENALKMHRRIALILKDEGIIPVLMLQPLLALDREKPMPPIERELFEFNISSYQPNYEKFIRSARDTAAVYESAMAKELGAQFFELTGIFRDVPHQMYTDYCHLTPKGNRVGAE